MRTHGANECRLASFVRPDVLILDVSGSNGYDLRPRSICAGDRRQLGPRPTILTTNRAFDDRLSLFEQPVHTLAAERGIGATADTMGPGLGLSLFEFSPGHIL